MTAGARRSTDPRVLLTPTDPHHAILRRSIRTAGVFPVVVALGLYGVQNAQFTLFAGFGTFGLLSLINLGGTPVARARAFVVIIGTGMALILVGSLARPHVAVAAGVMLVVVFVLQYTTVFGGFFSAGEPAVLLPFVIAIMVPVPAPTLESIVQRELGWFAAGIVATAVVTWWWPTSEPRQVLHDLAEAARRIGAVLVLPAEAPHDDRVDEAMRTLRATREGFLRDPNRPAGPSRHDQAVVMLLDELTRAIEVLERWSHPCDEAIAPEVEAAHDALAGFVSATFDAAATSIESGTPVTVDLATLERRRAAHLRALEAWAHSAIPAGSSADDLLAVADHSFPVRVLSYAALSVAANASIAAGSDADFDAREIDFTVAPRVPTAAGRARPLAILGAHLHRGSVWFRNSTRAAVALTLALVVARLAQADNAFWVVLGTLAVLRSNAAGTGRSALQAVAGNLVGVLVAAGLLAVTTGYPAALWMALVISVFLAAYTPAAVHFAVGQAAFSVWVVVLFALLQPDQGFIGVTRITDVAMGVLVGVVVAVLFWPRGASGRLRASIARLWLAGAQSLGRSEAAVLDPAAPMPHSAQDLLTVRAQADEAFRLYLTERGTKRVGVDAWANLFGTGSALRLAADSLDRMAELGLRVAPTPDGSALARDHIARAWDERIGQIEAMVDLFGGGSARATPTATLPMAAMTRAMIDDALRADATVGFAHEHDVQEFLALVFMGEWLRVVDHLIDSATASAEQARVGVTRPWWR